MNLLAKTIIPEQFWVVVNEFGKVGNIDKIENGYSVKINGNQHLYSSRDDIQREFSIVMDSGQVNLQKDVCTDLPSDGEVYNPVIDIKKKLHLFTKTHDSKCYYASGWFVLEDGDSQEIVLCPKYIFLQRKKYLGPFYTKEQAQQAINDAINN